MNEPSAVSDDGYIEALRWLYGLAPRGMRLDLERMRAACARRGNPQAKLRVVHVAGTNGKGSTAATIERIARAAGLRTGLYTSPHLHSFTERIRIDGLPLAREEVVERAASLRAMLDEPLAPELTFFEVTTLLAFEAFAARSLDLVVLEVGLGGRLDATNVVERPLVSVITHVDLDHQAQLGSTLAEIAGEKAGIVKAGTPVVHGADRPEDAREGGGGRAAIDRRASELGAPSFALGRELGVEVAVDGTLTVCFRGRTISRLAPRLMGQHQRDNVALAVGAAILAAEVLPIDEAAIARGVAEVDWPARLEIVELTPAPGTLPGARARAVLFDVAHNPDGARSLASFLRERARTRGERVALVFGAMADKDWRAMLDLLAPAVEDMIYVAPALERAERPEVLATHRSGLCAPSVGEGVQWACARADFVVVGGSTFVVSRARALVLGLPEDPPIAL